MTTFDICSTSETFLASIIKQVSAGKQTFCVPKLLSIHLPTFTIEESRKQLCWQTLVSLCGQTWVLAQFLWWLIVFQFASIIQRIPPRPPCKEYSQRSYTIAIIMWNLFWKCCIDNADMWSLVLSTYSFSRTQIAFQFSRMIIRKKC